MIICVMLFNNPSLWSSCTQNRIFTGFRSMYWSIIVHLFHANGNSWNLDESVYDSYPSSSELYETANENSTIAEVHWIGWYRYTGI